MLATEHEVFNLDTSRFEYLPAATSPVARTKQIPHVKVRIFLLRNGIPQQQVADAIGVHKSTISLLLDGKLVIEARLDQIAAYLGISRRHLDNLIYAKPKKKAA